MLEKLETYLQQTDNYCNQKEWHQAIQITQKALVYCCYQLLLDNPHLATAEDYYYLAVKLQEDNQLDEAINCYHLALKLNPNSTQANYGLAEILSQQEKWQQAFNYYQKASNIDDTQETLPTVKKKK